MMQTILTARVVGTTAPLGTGGVQDRVFSVRQWHRVASIGLLPNYKTLIGDDMTMNSSLRLTWSAFHLPNRSEWRRAAMVAGQTDWA